MDGTIVLDEQGRLLAVQPDPGGTAMITWRLDPGANRWERLITRAAPPNRFNGLVVQDRKRGALWLIGGTGASDVHRLELATLVWTPASAPPVPEGAMRALFFDEGQRVLWLLGQDGIYSLEIDRGTLRQRDRRKPEGSGPLPILVDEKRRVLLSFGGGARLTPRLDEGPHLVWELPLSDGSWRRARTTGQLPRTSYVEAVIAEDALWAVISETEGTWRLDLDRRVWERIADEPRPGDNVSSFRFVADPGGRALWLVGANEAAMFAETWRFDLATRRWRKLEQPLQPRPPGGAHVVLVDSPRRTAWLIAGASTWRLDLDRGAWTLVHEAAPLGASARTVEEVVGDRVVGWHTNTRKAYEGRLVGGKRHGPWVFWRGDGNKEMEGAFAAGLKQGRWIFYGPSGVKREEADYQADVLNGHLTTYAPISGRKRGSGQYRAGRLVSWSQWDGSGRPEDPATYCRADADCTVIWGEIDTCCGPGCGPHPVRKGREDEWRRASHRNCPPGPCPGTPCAPRPVGGGPTPFCDRGACAVPRDAGVP